MLSKEIQKLVNLSEECVLSMVKNKWLMENEGVDSESKEELDRFIVAMKSIRQEIQGLATGMLDTEDNVLVNSPHPISELTADNWDHKYSRKDAAFPVDYLNSGNKFWAVVSRVDNAFGDRNLICTCPPLSAYED